MTASRRHVAPRTSQCRVAVTGAAHVGIVVSVGLLVGVVVFVSGGVLRAAAGYGSFATGVGSAASQNIPVPSAPVAVAVGSNVTVSWTAITLSGGVPPSGYVVERLDSFGAAVATLPTCDVVSAATSCTESSVPAGTWSYRVRGILGSWSGAPSDPSATITTLSATVAWSTAMPITTLPATVAGTLTSFVVGEALTFRLDSPSGPLLVGTPVTVSVTTGQAVSVVLPAGTTDAPHSVYVIGSGGSVAGAAVSIVIPPVLTSLTTHDVDVDGRIDEVRASFDDVLAPYTAGVTPWTLTNIPSGGTLAGVTVAGNVATLAIAEGSGAATTAVGTFGVALSVNSAGIRDAYGNTTSFTSRTPTDAAPPVPATMVMQDTTGNGRVDRVAITWTETLAAVTTATAPWSLANVPSGATTFTVTASGTSGTITITEGAGALDTGVGAMTVSLSASPTGPRDAAGNQSTFPARAPTDGARPLLVSFTDTNGVTDGRVEAGDTLSALFTEPLATGSIPSAPTVTFTDPNTTGADRLTINGLTNGARTTGGNGYVSTNNVSYSHASAVTFTNGDRTAVVTIGAACTGTCTALGTQATNATFSFQPAPGITDVAGNLIRTTARTSSIRLF